MRNIIKYKGYAGLVEFDGEDKMFFGRVMDITDVLTFEGVTVEELENDFHAVIDEYLDFCKEIGKEPERPFSGRFIVRMPPELHRSIAVKAKSNHKSINAWVTKVLADAAEESAR